MFKKPETTSLIGPEPRVKRQSTNDQTTSVIAALYEIKLISLLYFRAFHDDTIEEFKLAANVKEIDLFGDICFKAKVKGIDKPLQLFIQAPKNEHRTCNLEECFGSYLRIREQFEPIHDNLFLEGGFNETECFFVIYTNELCFSLKSSGNSPLFRPESSDKASSVKLKDLIGTGGIDKQIYFQQKHSRVLCEVCLLCKYDENLVEDFCDRLVLYYSQADLYNLEKILKNEIENYQRDQLNYTQAESDVTFLRYFDQIQKWWISSDQIQKGGRAPTVAQILSRESNVLKIIEDTLMRKLNANYMSEMKQYNYTFTQLALSSLNLKKLSNTIIITENSILTVVKVIQNLKNNAHLVLNFENIQIDELAALRTELKYTNHDKVLILVCDDIQNEKINAFEIITIRKENMIIITNQTMLKTVQKYLKADSILHDTNLSLIDLSEESQMAIFKSATVIVPGVEEEIQLDLLLKGWPKPASRSSTSGTSDVSIHAGPPELHSGR